MPKGKTHKGLNKRVRITASGKVVHKRSCAGHLMSHKTGKKVRKLRRPMLVTKSISRQLQQMLHTGLKGREQS